MAGKFAGKAIVVTGAASGIGAATTRAFAAEGGNIVLADIADAAGQAIADELNGKGMTARYFHVDATREADAAALVAFVVSEFGRLDIAVNVVGNQDPDMSPTTQLHEETIDNYTKTVALNLGSTFFGMKHQIIQMLRQGGGVIANTTSMAGLRVSNEATASYAAAKAGVVHLSEHAAVRYADRNIRVNVVAPGLTATPAVRSAFSDEKLLEMAKRTQPMNRLMLPEDQAAAFLWLCSDDAAGVTGLTIPVAGGWAAV